MTEAHFGKQDNSWGDAPEVVEVSQDNIATLFTPYGNSSSVAWCIRARCEDLEITEDSELLRLRILKRYGPTLQLGQITKWKDRSQPAAQTFIKGDTAHLSVYVKPGSSETRTLTIWVSKDAGNSFLLEASTGEKCVGDNVEISKRFSLIQVEYRADSFTQSRANNNGSYQLFLPQF